ncbi:MAG: Outer rane vitamin receptor BtuB [Rhodocyclales bacterium]|nr:Outer rane vitamin receptor BtuB [Rhodocyclales bacterium]
MVVTANRVARTADETLAPVSVVTRKDIERLQAQSVPDALRGLPGVMFVNNGGAGKNTSLFLRGTNSNHVLVMIDGVKVGSATLGAEAWQDIPIEQVERIEVVRGPRASLYGSEAIGGVIQIFTKKGAQKPAFSLGAGTRGTFESSASAGFGSSDNWLSLSGSANKTRGINACQSNTSAGCFVAEPDRDGYSNTSVSLRGGGRLAESLNGELQYLQFNGHNRYDGSIFGGNEAGSNQQIFGGTLNYVPFDAWRSSLHAGQDTDDSKAYKDGTFVSRFMTRRDSGSWQNDVTLAKGHTLVMGLDYLRDKVVSTTAYNVRSRANRAVFSEYLADVGAFSFQLAGRHDDNEQFGSHNTGSAATGYAFSKALRLTASYGTAFKAPTFNELYFPGFGTPTLQPEKSRNREVGASGEWGENKDVGKWQVSVFDNRISQLIVTDPVTFTAQNLSRARIHGVELSASQRWANTSLGANATFQNPKDHSGASSEGNLLARRPRQTARVDADHDIGAWSFGTSWLGVGKRYDNAANTIHLGGYSTWDLRTEYRVNTDWRVQLRFENVFDRRYETAYLFNQPGFGAFLTLRYQPK